VVYLLYQKLNTWLLQVAVAVEHLLAEAVAVLVVIAHL
jgi:hypothetical protein